jgi:hypothetical protein
MGQTIKRWVVRELGFINLVPNIRGITHQGCEHVIYFLFCVQAFRILFRLEGNTALKNL